MLRFEGLFRSKWGLWAGLWGPYRISNKSVWAAVTGTLIVAEIEESINAFFADLDD